MQFNATLKTKIGDLHIEIINDLSDIKRKMEFLSDKDYLNDNHLGDIIENASKMMKSFSYFKSMINDLKNKKIENAEWQEAS